ncbi:MAG TPA: hypothetical protein VNX21_03300 [Candidatus Thermoplasmatota archaeon]|nr:hypothetical protein [Candidatus Thermoplasmatota archaeon]
MMLRRLAALPVLLALTLLAPAEGLPAPKAADCELLAAAAVWPGDVGSLAPCPGIGPGSALVLRIGPYSWLPAQVEEAYCSMAFVVTDGTDLYVATAGHCVEDSLGVPSLGERVSAHGVPGTFGTVAYQWCEGQAANGGCAAGTDFGLIRIDADKRSYVHAEMCRWGKASGVYTATSGSGFVQHYGWGLVLGSSTHLGANKDDVHVMPGNPATQARQGLLVDPTFTASSALIETAGISGDSGSGVLATSQIVVPGLTAPEAKALGVFTHVSVGGIGIVQRLDVSLAKAGADMGKTFTLVTEL